MPSRQLLPKAVKRLGRFLIRSCLIHRLPKPYTRERGFAWSARLAGLRHRADCSDHPARSPLLVYEDGQVLSHPHSKHIELYALGEGRYSHWEDRVVFSTWDNSDPNRNGRVYSYSLSPWLYRRYQAGSQPGSGSQPTNYRTRHTETSAVQEDVGYAIAVGRGYLKQVQGAMTTVAGKKVLEVGPGINFGAALYLACHGAAPVVADRFLAAWDPDYHLPLYTRMRDRLHQDEPYLDLRPLEAILAARGYPETVLGQRECSLETLDLADNSTDLIFSQAVVEHLWDIPRAAEQLYRVTRPGGWGFHQVDFRYHRDFQRPLEQLTLSGEEFRVLFDYSHGEVGTCLRPVEVARLFREAGFVTSFKGNTQAEPAYLQDFIPRLRTAAGSPYRDFPTEELQVLSGMLSVRKPS
jgi:SAM-dependent methyltransferase